MAEVIDFRNNTVGYPVFGAPWGVVFPIYDADGDLVTGAAGLDSEVSLNGDSFADCTNEATEIGSSGMYYLLLTGTEMFANVVAVVVKTSTTGAKTTAMVFYPRLLTNVTSGVSQGDASNASVTLATGESTVDNYYKGMHLWVSIDGVVNVRMISAYVGSTRQANVYPYLTGTPDNNDAYTIDLLEGAILPTVNVTAISTAAANDVADGVLKRDWTSVTGEASRSVLNALRFLRNLWSLSGGTLTVKKEDDTTTAWTATVTTDAAAEPIIGSDPS